MYSTGVLLMQVVRQKMMIYLLMDVYNVHSRHCSRQCLHISSQSHHIKLHRFSNSFSQVISQWPRMFSMNMMFRNVKRCISHVMFLKSRIICTVEILKKKMYSTVVFVLW